MAWPDKEGKADLFLLLTVDGAPILYWMQPPFPRFSYSDCTKPSLLEKSGLPYLSFPGLPVYANSAQ